jgi:hypothetical protein
MFPELSHHYAQLFRVRILSKQTEALATSHVNETLFVKDAAEKRAIIKHNND